MDERDWMKRGKTLTCATMMNHGFKQFLAVLAGVAMAWVAGLLLWPLVDIGMEKFFHFDFGRENTGWTKDDFFLMAIFMAWFFIASGCGGVACSLVHPQRMMLLLCTVCQIIILLFIVGPELFSVQTAEPWLLLLMIPAGYFLGGWLTGKYSRKNNP